MPKAGDVVLTSIQFTDTFEVKIRPAVVLFQERGNIVVAGITSNTRMQGIPLTKKEGAIRESVIKLNYLYTVSEAMIVKVLFSLSKEKRERIKMEMGRRLSGL